MKDTPPCSLCGLPVEPDRYGRPRRFHPDCRREWRSEMMRDNERATGARQPKKWRGGELDAIKTDAYQHSDADAIRRVGVAYWGELADFSYWCFDKLNPLCFGNRIHHPLFQFCRVMPYGGCIAVAYVDDLERPVIDVFLSLWTRKELPYLQVFAVIAHEMMHFSTDMAWRDAGAGRFRTSHNNEFWFAGVKQASPLLGVDLRRMKKPFEHWPILGWSGAERKKLNEALRRRRFPW
jgi:hypothetical protein